MPRLARLDAPGVVHHIMIRGIERRRIFRDNKDRRNFLDRLEALLTETQTACYAWALMPNHAHFLFRTGNVPLATLMRRLLTGYVVTFNRRHKRAGQLFQNRYKSIVCQEDLYIKELVRYIHLNPIRAGLVSSLSELEKHPYCGHSVLAGTKEAAWQDVDYVLGYFGGGARRARPVYLSYVEAGVEQGRRDELTGGGLIRSLGGWSEVQKLRLKGLDHIKSDERILGESDFVDDVLSRAEERYERRYNLARRGYDLNRLTERVGEICDLDPGEIMVRGKQKKKVKARSLLCFWAVTELGLSLTDLARYFGMTVSAIGYAVERGGAIARDHHYELVEET